MLGDRNKGPVLKEHHESSTALTMAIRDDKTSIPLQCDHLNVSSEPIRSKNKNKCKSTGINISVNSNSPTQKIHQLA